MGKAIIILVLLVAGGFAIVLYMGSRVVAPQDGDGGGFKAPELPDTKDIKDAARKAAEAAKEATERAAREAKAAAEKAKAAAEKAGLLDDKALKSLKLEKEPIEVMAGGRTEVKITRVMKDLPPLKLELAPADGSKIRASGGEFKQGQSETTITVEAEAGAHSASLTIKGSDGVKLTVPVRVN